MMIMSTTSKTITSIAPTSAESVITVGSDAMSVDCGGGGPGGTTVTAQRESDIPRACVVCVCV